MEDFQTYTFVQKRKQKNNKELQARSATIGGWYDSGKMVAIPIEEFFERNDPFGSFQFGFRKGKNTVSELLTLFDRLLDAKQDKKEILLIMYDLSSAFHLADHKILISKLKVYGFDSNALKWVESYLKKPETVCHSLRKDVKNN